MDQAAEPETMDQIRTQQFALETFLPYRLSLLSNTVSEGIATRYRTDHGLSMTEWRVLAILGRYPASRLLM